MKKLFTSFAMLLYSLSAWAQLSEILPGRSTPVYTNFEEQGITIESSAALEKLHTYFQLDSRYSFNVISRLNDELGFTHTRYQQYCNGIPVEGSMWILHERNHRVASVNGDVFNIKSNDVQPTLTEEAALAAALKHIQASVYMWQLPKSQLGDDSVLYGQAPRGELVYVPKDGDFNQNAFRLAYKFDIYAAEPMQQYDVFVDAMNGEYLWKVSKIHEINVTGNATTLYSGTQNITIDSISASSYKLHDFTRGNGIRTTNLNNATSGTGSDVTSTTKSFTSGSNYVKAIYDAHWGLALTYDYFNDSFSRNSYDGLGGALLVRTRYGTNYDNAFWSNRTISFGDGSTFSPLTSLDVAGHEFSHGVTQYTAKLYYNGESGALNESFSDIFGNCIEFVNKPATASWALGEDLISGGLRNMSNPKAKNDPNTYQGTYWVTIKTDNFGVHTNSGVQNYWFYLLSVGGSGTNDISNSYSVTGIGMHKAAKIAYRNLSVYLTPAADYKMARQFAIQSARDLYGACSNEVTQTTAAWYAVGVGGNTAASGASFTNTPTSTCNNYLTVKFDNTSPSVQSSLWYFGDGDTSTVNNPTHTYTQPGTYNVKLVVTHCNNQKDSVTVNAAVTISNTTPFCDTIRMNKPTQSTTLCNVIVTDDGGINGKYGNDSATYLLFNNPAVSQYKVTILRFKTENNSDYFYVMNGDSITSSYNWYVGSPNIGSLSPVITTSNKLLLLFEPDATVNDSGFVIKVECITPLPIELKAWNATARNCNNYLQWSVDDVKNFSHFDIERSAEEGRNFTAIAKQPIEANKTTYQYTDYASAAIENKVYYRLKMVDLNGGFTYSDIRTVLPNCNGKTAITLAPNPAETVITLQSGEAIKHINVLSVKGAIIKSLTMANEKQCKVDISNLAAGLYVVEIETSQGVKQYKSFVKQ